GCTGRRRLLAGYTRSRQSPTSTLERPVRRGNSIVYLRRACEEHESCDPTVSGLNDHRLESPSRGNRRRTPCRGKEAQAVPAKKRPPAVKAILKQKYNVRILFPVIYL